MGVVGWGWSALYSRQPPQANGGEEVDGKSRILWIVSWQQALERSRQHRIPQLLIQLGQAHELGELLEQNLDEYTTEKQEKQWNVGQDFRGVSFIRRSNILAL